MNVGIDPEGLFTVYADWIAFLREKRATFEGQLAKLQGKDLPGKDSSDKSLPPNPNGQETETTSLPVTPQITTSQRKEKKTKNPTPAPVLAVTSLPEDALPLSESENETITDEKVEEIPEWLWQAESEETPSPDMSVEDEEMDDWM